MYSKYDFSPFRIAVNAEYRPDCGRLVPILIVSPETPVVGSPRTC